MNSPTFPASSTSRGSRPMRKFAVLAAVIGGIAMMVGALAQTAAVGGWHHGGAHAISESSEDIVSHVNGMLQYIYAEVGATEQQKAQLASIVQQAAADLAPLHDELDIEHTQMFGLLTQSTIDRTALETVRVAQMSVADQASTRVMQFLADVAEALTPAQRKALADHLSQHAS